MSRKPEPLATSAFDYSLPAELIARHPAQRRDESRLLVLHRATGLIRHQVFRDLPTLPSPGDVLVLNESRVMPARLLGRKRTGARVEVLLVRRVDGESADAERWEALVRPGSKLRPGAVVDVAEDLRVEIGPVTEQGGRVVRLVAPEGVAAAIAKHGRVPLPPYIDREATAQDTERYQTVYARVPGSVAAPTAGLHLTPHLLGALESMGVRIARIVLHVGPGTFRPVEAEDPAGHVMHPEQYHVPAEAADTIVAARAAGGRVWAVGTTVVRTLETAAGVDGTVRPGSGRTTLFIRPGYRFKVVDRLVTNFHLPRSTLLMLVAAFGGYDAVMNAYREAIRSRYRFYSYGDAMAII